MEDEALLMLIINPGQTLTSNELPCECGGQPVSVAGCLGAIEHNLAKCQNKHYLPHMAVLTKTSNLRSKRLSHLHLLIEHK